MLVAKVAGGLIFSNGGTHLAENMTILRVLERKRLGSVKGYLKMTKIINFSKIYVILIRKIIQHFLTKTKQVMNN